MGRLYLDPTPLLAILPESPNEAAAAAGVNARTIHEWRKGRRVQLNNADRIAVNLGHHPAEIWPNWWEIPAITPEEKRAAEAERRARRHQAHKHDPEYRARQKANKVRYKARLKERNDKA